MFGLSGDQPHSEAVSRRPLSHLLSLNSGGAKKGILINSKRLLVVTIMVSYGY